jgi:hypothetical protein
MPLFPTLFAREADLREAKSNIYVDYFSKIKYFSVFLREADLTYHY